MANQREKIREDQLRNWDLLAIFRQKVLPLLKAQAATATEEDTRRTLFADDYFCLFLFSILNPVITSMRALCHVSHCGKMRRVSRAPFVRPAFRRRSICLSPGSWKRWCASWPRKIKAVPKAGTRACATP